MSSTRTIVRVAPFVGPRLSLGRRLHAVGAAARAVLQTLARWVHREETAAVGPTTRAQEANLARDYALSFSRTDPRFAADLCAAADRHEVGENT